MKKLIQAALSFVYLVGLQGVLVANAGQGPSKTVFSPRDISAIYENLERVPDVLPIAESHPDYPLSLLALALKAEKHGDAKRVVQLLEPLLIHTQYEGIANRTSDTAQNSLVGQPVKMMVGTVGSFDLWRELAYLTLGRAYYQMGQDDRALTYFNAIPDSSTFSIMANLEGGWSNLRLRDTESAKKRLELLEKASDSVDALYRKEIGIQRAFFHLESNELDKAIAVAESIDIPEVQSRELYALRLKLLAQAKLSSYLARSQTLTYSDKKAALESTVHYAEGVPASYRDAEFSFLVAETYWHLASVLRIEDPVKLRPTWIAHLNRANGWLTPHVERAIKQGQAELSEDALFLSVAVLWEQERFIEAVPRLLAIKKSFPQGEYREDTNQLLADHFYDAGEYAQALLYYGELARVGSPEKAAYGVYKAAWTFYNKDEKWKALRHLERLVLSRNSELANVAGDGDKGGMLVEAQKDMLLIMAELLGYKQALAELEIFKFPAERRQEVRERLATVYKEVGKYEDSVNVYQVMMADNKQPERAYKWLEELSGALLAAGKRDLLAKAVDYYLPSMPNGGSAEDQARHQALEKKLIAITLTVHREAKKSDDIDIWKATDALYTSLAKHFPNTAEGDFWYFGAQRREQLGKKWEALEWYRKAGQTLSYANAPDSALSVLRIARDLGSEKILDKDKNLQAAHTLAQASQWYIEHFRKSPQRKLAELMLMEFLQKGGEPKKAEEYLVTSMQEEGATPDHQEQYFAFNRRLYEAGNWAEGFGLAGQVLTVSEKSPKQDPVFTLKVTKFQQETAFQNAFNFEKKSDWENCRIWYQRAIASPADAAITLKAWNNLLFSYQLPGDAQKLIEAFQEFERTYKAVKETSAEKLKTLFSIYARSAEAWDALDEPVRRALSLTKAIEYEPDPIKSDLVRWDTLIAFGTYYQVTRMKQELEILRSHRSALLSEPKNQLTVARLLFWNGDHLEAWRMLKGLTGGTKPFPPAWVFVGDIYAYARNVKSPLYPEIRDFLVANRQQLDQNAVLQPLYTEIIYPNLDLRKLAVWGEGPKRTIAQAPDLKGRVGEVGEVLKTLNSGQETLKNYVRSPALKVSITAICAAPALHHEAIRRLEKLKVPAIASAQWPDFIKKIDAKIQELQQIAAQEKSVCDQRQPMLAFMTPNRGLASALCEQSSCFPERPEKLESLATLEKGWRVTPISRLEKVNQYLHAGAWAPAESVAYQSPSARERSLLLGYIRLAMADTWNAAPLLQEAEKDSKLTSHAKLFLGATASNNGYSKIASEQLIAVQKKTLLDWESMLYDRLAGAGNAQFAP